MRILRDVWRQDWNTILPWVLAGLLLVTVTIEVVAQVMHTRIRTALLEREYAQAMALTQGLAVNAAEALATADRLLLTEWVEKTSRLDPNILHAAVVDENRSIMAHSTYTHQGRAYTVPPHTVRKMGEQGEIWIYKRGKEFVGNFVVPVWVAERMSAVKRQRGTAHIAYSLASVTRVVDEPWHAMNMAVIIGLGLGLVVAGGMVVLARRNPGDQAEDPVRRRYEHDVVKRIQDVLVSLPDPDIPGYSLGMLCRAAEEVQSGFCDCLRVGRNQWGLAVADISGQGLAGVLALMNTHERLLRLAYETVSPSQVISDLNAQVYAERQEDCFLALAYVVLDPAKRLATVACAGPVTTVLYRHATRDCEFEMHEGVPMGIADPETFNLTVSERRLRLRPGDVLLFYTEGVDEAVNFKQDAFGSERVVSTLQRVAHQSADEIVRQLSRAIQTFSGSAPQSKDRTLMALKLEEDAR